MNTYKTAEAAQIIGIHPNTVRLYEKLELIPKAERQENGYRIFTEFHIQQLRLARLALQAEVLQNGLRKRIVEIVKVSAKGDFDRARILTEEYLRQVRLERENAEKAIIFVRQVLSIGVPENKSFMKRKEVSDYLGISMDSLRNWEMNGLLEIKRRKNGYRIYTQEDLQRLIVIRSLRCANYSLEAILRMLRKLSKDPHTDLKAALDTPDTEDDIISACDRLISSLAEAEKKAEIIIGRLLRMKSEF